jgi:hypothetical protein
MEAATDPHPPPAGAGFLAGLQAGMWGVLSYLAFMGLSASLQRRTFWTAANLMASTFYAGEALGAAGFAWPTVTGLALYVVVYGLLGAAFGCAVRDRLAGRGALVAGLTVGLAWYYISFRLLWRIVNPMIPLLYAEYPTLAGHLVYGAFLGSAPVFYRALRPTPSSPTTVIE